MKYFFAKRDSKIKCIFCDEIFLKGSKRVVDNDIYIEFGEFYTNRCHYHYECGIKFLSEKNKKRLINCKEKK